MSTLGYVQFDKKANTYRGNVRRLAIRIEPNGSKSKDTHPDYRIMTPDNDEIGAGWIKTGKQSGKKYVSLSFAAPELGSKILYANLGVAAGQDDPDAFAIIWNPES